MSDPVNTGAGESASLTGTSVGRFAIRERLGVGGMGEVYRAEDTRLNRSVAIKRMSGAMRSDPVQCRRFVKEAERASQLTDPHIAALYDILEEQGEIFLVMEFVDGCNLRQRMAQQTNLKDFVNIAIQAAEGLRTAHARDIVHCDIKPENIMITSSGQVKILDFGLARQLSRREGYASSFVSGNFGISGTLGYIAPEIMQEEAPDPRADIFSLGVVFYEALAGTHPFLQRTILDTANSVLKLEPTNLQAFGVPRQLADIVARMMAKNPVDRYQTADELLADLRVFADTVQAEQVLSRTTPKRGRFKAVAEFVKGHNRIAVASVLVLVLAGLAGIAIKYAEGIGRLLGVSKAPHVAVLPFRAVGGQQGEQAFAEGLTDVITTELAQLSGRYVLQVVSANEVRSEGVKSAKEARQQFGVDLVVECSLQQVANMIRATYSVVDAETGRQVRADTIAVPADDPFGLQDQLAKRIVAALGIDVADGDREQLAERGTTVSAAYNYYLQGLGYLRDYQKTENIELALAAFNRALQHDGSYALAYAGLGEAHWHKYQELGDTSEMSDATLACQRALAIDADLVEGHRCLGKLYVSSGKYKEAAEALEAAVAKRPTDDESVRALGRAYEQLQQFDKAEATYRRAIDMRPHYWAGYNRLGSFYSRRGQYSKALEMFQRVAGIAPDNYRGYNNAGGIYILQGDFGRAIEQFERSVQIKPSYEGYSNLGTAYFFQRRFAQAAAAYAQTVQLNDRDYVAWGNLGDAQYFAAGKREEAPESYRKAIELAGQQLKVNPSDAGALGRMAIYYAMLEQRDKAEDCLRRALALKPSGPDVWRQAAVVYSRFGRKDETITALRSALAAGLSSAYVRSAPYFDNLDSDPAFQELMKSAERLDSR